MGNEEQSRAGRAGAPAAGDGPAGVPFHKQTGVLAGAAALISLGVGVLLGRATAPAQTEPQAVRIEQSLVAAPRETPDDAINPEPPTSYRFRATRLPKGETGGFLRDDTDRRRAARITGNEGKLRFEIEPSASDYALTAMLRIDNAATGSVKPSIDGRALGAWTVRGEWGMYTVPVATDLLSNGYHDLSLAVSGLPASAAVQVDSISVAPITHEVNITIGPASAGYLVDGFGKREGGAVWSVGPRSMVGAVLTPLAVPYQLEVQGHALPRLAPLQVKAKVNGVDLGVAEIESEKRETTWAVPAKVLRAGVNEVEFIYPKTSRPVDYNPSSKDKRALAIRYTGISLTPAQ